MSDYDTATRIIYLQRERAKKARDAKDDKIKGGNFFTILEDYPAPEVWPELADPPRPETQDTTG